MNNSAQIATDPALRIVLTRSAEDCAVWADDLRQRGIASVSLPCIKTEPIDSPSLRVAVNNAITSANWLVFTSHRGVRALAALLDRPLPAQVRVAVIGDVTAHTARSLLGRVDYTAKIWVARRLAKELAAHIEEREQKIILALAENAGDVLASTLTEAGQQCLRFDVYRTIPAAATGTRVSVADVGANTVFLASPSAVLGFVNQVDVDESARLVSIGPTTSAAIERAGLSVYAEAAKPSLVGMLDAIKD